MPHRRKLTIPKRYKAGLSGLLKLPDDVHEVLANTLREAKPVIYQRNLIPQIASGLESVENSKEVAEALVSLYFARGSEDNVTDFVAELTDAMALDGDPALLPPDGDWEQVKTRLTTLLDFEHTIGVAIKAFQVMAEHEHVYCNAGTRILTDIRPVFTSDVTELPAAAVIVHSLKIAYHQGGETKEFFVALDSRDVKELREILDRADKKAESLRSILEGLPIQYLDPEVE